MLRYAFLLFAALLVREVHAGGIPDTGQDLCDNGINVLVPCTSVNTGNAAIYPGQDGRFGRDAQATAGTQTKFGGGGAGFDYSKVANNGSDLGAGVGLALGNKPEDWACTRDNITGLTWEVKVNDPTKLRHMDWLYSWYSSDGNTNGGNVGLASTAVPSQYRPWCATDMRCDTEKFVADVNAATLCGHADWRLPTLRELLTLVHAGRQSPAIDTTYFPNTASSFFLTATSFVNDPTNSMSVYFKDGSSWGGRKDQYGINVNRVLLVRGAQF